MITKILLDENDIREVLAEHFQVDEHQVFLSTEEKSIGYGLNESSVYVPRAEITKE